MSKLHSCGRSYLSKLQKYDNYFDNGKYFLKCAQLYGGNYN